jgi:glycosyltransferase involved in cell wall biosynthesis
MRTIHGPHDRDSFSPALPPGVSSRTNTGRRPRVQLLVDCYFPSTKSGAKLVHDLAVELNARGCDVCVACPDESLRSQSMLSNEDGVDVLRIRTGPIKSAGRVVRAINEFRLSRTMWSAGQSWFQRHPADLIVFYSPTIFFGGLVRQLKAAWRCPSYLILRDIFPQWAVDAGQLRPGLILRFFQWVERRQYDAADVIGVQSPGNLQYFHDAGLVDKYHLEVLYNWTVLDEEHVPVTNFREQWGLRGKTIFFYGGNLGVAQDLDNLLRLAAALRDRPEAHVLLVGDGSEAGRLRQAIADRGLNNVSLYPSVDQQTYQGLLAEVDVGLVSLDARLKTQNIPGKILGYMQHRLPTLASLNPGNDLDGLFREHAAGLTAWNGDHAAFATAARRLADDVELRAELGRNGRRMLEEVFSVERCASQILRHLPSHVRPAAASPRRERRAA